MLLYLTYSGIKYLRRASLSPTSPGGVASPDSIGPPHPVQALREEAYGGATTGGDGDDTRVSSTTMYSMMFLTLTFIFLLLRDLFHGEELHPTYWLRSTATSGGGGAVTSGVAETSPPNQQHTNAPPAWAYKGGHASHGDNPVEASVPSWVYQTAASRAADAAAAESRGLPSTFQIRGAGGLLAQDAEDEYAMVNFFAGKKGGIIMESGALDGKMFSISWAFTEYWGWHAVHVEGFRPNYQALVRNRPDQLNIHAALCNSTVPLHWIKNDDLLTSINGFWEYISKEVKDKWFSQWSDELVGATLPATTCRPLTPLLSQFALHHIDLWVLDIEGSEHMALSTVDWATTEIDVISVEVLQPQTAGELENELKVRNILYENNYFEHSMQGRNTWYVRGGFQPSSCAASPHLCQDLPKGVELRSPSYLERLKAAPLASGPGEEKGLGNTTTDSEGSSSSSSSDNEDSSSSDKEGSKSSSSKSSSSGKEGSSKSSSSSSSSKSGSKGGGPKKV